MLPAYLSWSLQQPPTGSPCVPHPCPPSILPRAASGDFLESNQIISLRGTSATTLKGTHSRWYKYKALASPWPQSCHSPAHTVPWLLMAQGIKRKLPTSLPLPTSPASSQLLSSSTLFFLLSGQVKLVPPQGLCTCCSWKSLFLDFVRWAYSLCRVLAQMSLPWRGCDDCLSKVLSPSGPLSIFYNLF